MAAIDKAIILAAGLGNRISAISKDTPKPLLSLDGTLGGPTFLDWHLNALSKAGVREIYVVGNKRTHGTKLQAMSKVKAEWILNPTDDLSTSGSAHSTWFAMKSDHAIFDSKSRVVLMDADILYDTSLWQTLSDAPGSRSKTLICSDYRHTHEEVLVFGDPRAKETPRYHGKGLLDTPLVAGCTCLGEATGILLWEPHDHDVLRSVIDWTIAFSTAKARSEHEDITQRMMLLDRMDAVRFGHERAFMEVDTPEEYQVMVKEMYPKLRER